MELLQIRSELLSLVNQARLEASALRLVNEVAKVWQHPRPTLSQSLTILDTSALESLTVRAGTAALLTDFTALPLQPSPDLDRAAQGHVEDMGKRNYFSHRTPEGLSVGGRVDAAGYRNWRFLGEDITAGFDTAQKAFDAFMASEGHRNNIVNPWFVDLGVGFYLDELDEHNVLLPDGNVGGPYRFYWGLVFGQRTTPHVFVPDVQVHRASASVGS